MIEFFIINAVLINGGFCDTEIKFFGRDTIVKNLSYYMDRRNAGLYLRRIVCQLYSVKTLHFYYEEDSEEKDNILVNIQNACMMPYVAFW